MIFPESAIFFPHSEPFEADVGFLLELIFVCKNTFNRQIEQACDLKRQRQTRIKLARFYRIHRLARHIQRRCQISLCPISFGPQYFESIFYEYRARPTMIPAIYPPLSSIITTPISGLETCPDASSNA